MVQDSRHLVPLQNVPKFASVSVFVLSSLHKGITGDKVLIDINVFICVCQFAVAMLGV